MKLANIVLKTNPLGSSIVRRNVTPAEVMLLVGDFHQIAGGDPIIKITELAEDHEEKQLKPLRAKLEKARKDFETLEVTELTDEIRERRQAMLQLKIDRFSEQISHLEGLQALRRLDPGDEKKRLIGRYGANRVKRQLTGNIPTLPQSFEEARAAGIGSSSEDQSDRRLFTVGDTGA